MVIVVRGWREKREEGVESQMELVCPLYHTHHLKDNDHIKMTS